MKKILITGTNSYIGTSIEKWLVHCNYEVDTIDMKTNEWEIKNFSAYDVVIHVAGIAHVNSKRKMKDQYYAINRDLAIKTAKKAKVEKVKQYIFLSSIIVYGESGRTAKIIDQNTEPKPSNYYGDSKLQAENAIRKLQTEEFKTVILRLPMVYGKESKGNFSKLSKVAQILPVFPYINNERSMLHIDNLCQFIKLIIENQETGLFFPQNKDYVKTCDMVSLIAKIHKKNIMFTKIFNPILNLLSLRINVINKVFGTFVYERNMSKYKEDYCIRNFEESIRLSEDNI